MFHQLPETKVPGTGTYSSRWAAGSLVSTHLLELVGASVCYVPLSTADEPQIATVSWAEVADAWLRLLHATETGLLVVLDVEQVDQWYP